MANYATQLGETRLLLEAPASGAFAKSELEIKPDKSKAIVNCVSTIRDVASYMGKELASTLAKTGAQAEISFAVRADGMGLVMVSQDASEGQFQVTLRFAPRRPNPNAGRPRPPRPQQG